MDLVTYYSDAYGTVSNIRNREFNSLNESISRTIYGNYLFTAKAHKLFAKAAAILQQSWCLSMNLAMPSAR